MSSEGICVPEDLILALAPEFSFLLVRALGGRRDGLCDWTPATHVGRHPDGAPAPYFLPSPDPNTQTLGQ